MLIPLPVSSDVDTFMQSANQAEMRSALGAAPQLIHSAPLGSPYTFILSDAEKLVIVDVGNNPLTIPAFADVAFPVGTYIDVMLPMATFADWTNSIEVQAADEVAFQWSSGNASGLYVNGGQTVRLRNIAQDSWQATAYPIIPWDGIIKSDGAGNTNAAVPGTDYVAPGGAGTISTDTGWSAAGSTGDKTDSVENYSGAGIDGTMTAALNLVSAGLGDALVQDEARIKELIHFCQALQTALVASKRPNA